MRPVPQSLNQGVSALQLLSLAAVLNMTSASKASIYAWMQEGTFPKPRKLGNRRVAWLASDVENWINDLKIAA